MKKTLLIAGSMVCAIGAFSQGTVNFNNFISGSLRSPVYDVEPGNPTLELHGNAGGTSIPAGTNVYTGALLAGTGFTVQLWGHVNAGVPQNQLALLANATTTFRTGTGAGLVNTTGLPGGNVAIAVPGALTDGSAAFKGTFEVRAWNNAGGTILTWADALSAGAATGKSGAFSPPGDLGGTYLLPGSPALTPTLAGLTSFNLHVVPEPSLIALGALGLGALLLRRRKA